MATGLSTTLPNKLPLRATIGAAYAVTFRNLRSLGLVGLVWGPVVFAVLFALNWLFWTPPDAPFDGAKLFVAMLAIAFVSALIGATAAIAWHRLLLRGETVNAVAVLRLDRRTFAYVGLVLALTMGPLLVVLGPMFGIIGYVEGLDSGAGDPVSDLPEQASEAVPAAGGGPSEWPNRVWVPAVLAVIFVIGVPLSYPSMRWMIALPAIAVGDRGDILGRSWRATGGNFWRLYIGTWATTLPAQMSYFVGLGFQDRIGSSLVSAAHELTWLLAGLIYVSFLSLAYRHFLPDRSTLS